MTVNETKILIMAIVSNFPNFGTKTIEQTVSVWHMILEPYSYADIQQAFINYCRTNTSGFAPTTGQLINMIDYSTNEEMSGLSAWGLVSKALRNSTYNAEEEFKKLPEDVQKALGGSYQLHTWATDEDFNESVVSAIFQRNYKTICERKRFDRITGTDKLKLTGNKKLMIEEVNE